MTTKPSEAELDSWGDQSLPEDPAIAEAFPTRSGRHDLYAEAMRLVGAKRSKGALVALVNWLLHRAEAAVKRAAELEAALRVASAARPSITAAFMRGLEEGKRAPAAELAEANEKVAAFTRIAEKNQAELAALRPTLADAVTTTGDAMARAENAEAALANLRDRHGSCGLICGHLGECGPVHRPGKDL